MSRYRQGYKNFQGVTDADYVISEYIGAMSCADDNRLIGNSTGSDWWSEYANGIRVAGEEMGIDFSVADPPLPSY